MEDAWANWGNDASKLRTEDEEVKREQPTHQFHPAHIAATSQSNTLHSFNSARSPSFRNAYNDSRKFNGQHAKSSNGSMNSSTYSHAHKQPNPSFQQSRSYQSIQPVGRQQLSANHTISAKQLPILLGYGEPSSVREARLAQSITTNNQTATTTTIVASPRSVEPSTLSSRSSMGHPHQFEQNPSMSEAVKSIPIRDAKQKVHADNIKAASLAGQEVLPSSVSQGKSSNLSKTISSGTDASSDVPDAVIVRVHRNLIPPSVTNKITASKQITVPVSSPRDHNVSISTPTFQMNTTQESSKPDMDEPLVLHLSPTFPMDSIKKLKKHAFHIQTRLGAEGLSIKLVVAPEAVNNAYEASIQSHVVFKGGKAEEGLLAIIGWITAETEELYLPIDTHTRQIYEKLRPHPPPNSSENQKESDTSLGAITIYIPPSFPFNKAAELEDFVFELIEEPEFEDLERILNIPKGTEEEPGKWSVVLEGKGNRKAGKLAEIWVEKQIQGEKPIGTMENKQEKAKTGENGSHARSIGSESALEQKKEDVKVHSEKAPTSAGELLALLNLPEKQPANGNTSQEETPIPAGNTFAPSEANVVDASAYPTTVPSKNNAIWQETAAPPVGSSGWLPIMPLEAQPYQTTHNRMLSNGSLNRPSTAGVSNGHSDGHMSIDAPLQSVVNDQTQVPASAVVQTLRLPLALDIVKCFRGHNNGNFVLLEEVIPCSRVNYDGRDQVICMQDTSLDNLEFGRKVMSVFLRTTNWAKDFHEEVYRLGAREERVLRDIMSQRQRMHDTRSSEERIRWVVGAIREASKLPDQEVQYHEISFRLPINPVLRSIRGGGGCPGLTCLEQLLPVKYAIIRGENLLLQDTYHTRLKFGRRVVSILARLLDPSTSFQQESLAMEGSDDDVLQQLREKEGSGLPARDKRIEAKIGRVVELLKAGAGQIGQALEQSVTTSVGRSPSPENKRAMSPSVFSSAKVNIPAPPPLSSAEVSYSNGWQPVSTGNDLTELTSKAELSDLQSRSVQAILPPSKDIPSLPQTDVLAQPEHNPKEILANIARWSSLTTPTNSVRWTMENTPRRSRLLGYRRVNFNMVARITGVVAIFTPLETWERYGAFDMVVLGSENTSMNSTEKENLINALKAIIILCSYFDSSESAPSQADIPPFLDINTSTLLDSAELEIIKQARNNVLACLSQESSATRERRAENLVLRLLSPRSVEGRPVADADIAAVSAGIREEVEGGAETELSQEDLLLLAGPQNSVHWLVPRGSLRARLIGSGQCNLQMIRDATDVKAIFPHPTVNQTDGSRAMFILASDSQTLNPVELDRLVLALKVIIAICTLFARLDSVPLQQDVPTGLGINLDKLFDARDMASVKQIDLAIVNRGGGHRRTTDADLKELTDLIVAHHNELSQEAAQSTEEPAIPRFSPLEHFTPLTVFRAAKRSNSMRWSVPDGLVRARLVGRDAGNIRMISSLTGAKVIMEPGTDFQGRDRRIYIVGSMSDELNQQGKDNIRKALKAVVAILQLFGRRDEMGPPPNDIPAFLDMTRSTILNDAESQFVRAKEEELLQREGGIANNTDVDLRQLVVSILEIAGSSTLALAGEDHQSLETSHVAKSDAAHSKVDEQTTSPTPHHTAVTTLSQLLGDYLAPVYLSSAEEEAWCGRADGEADHIYVNTDRMASLGSAFWACYKVVELGKSMGIDLSSYKIYLASIPMQTEAPASTLSKSEQHNGHEDGLLSGLVGVTPWESASQQPPRLDEGCEIDEMDDIDDANQQISDWQKAAEEEELRQAAVTNIASWRGAIQASPNNLSIPAVDVPPASSPSPVASLHHRQEPLQRGPHVIFNLPFHPGVRLAVIGRNEENLRAIEGRTRAILELPKEPHRGHQPSAQLDLQPILVSGPDGAVKQALKELRSVMKSVHPEWRIVGPAGHLLRQYDLEEKIESAQARVLGNSRQLPKFWTPNLILFVPEAALPIISSTSFTSIGVGVSIDKVMLGKVEISASSSDHTEVALRKLRDIVRELDPNWIPEGEAEKLVREMDREDEKTRLLTATTGVPTTKTDYTRAADEAEVAPEVVGWYDNESQPTLPVGHGWAAAAPFIPEAERMNGHHNEKAGGRSWDHPRRGDERDSGRTDRKQIY